jgi:hypothetical protein
VHLHPLCISSPSPRQISCTTFALCTNIHYAQFWYRALIFHMNFFLCIAPCQSSTCYIMHNNLRTPLNTLTRDNLYSYYARTNKTPLCYAILAHPMCTLLCACSLHKAKFSTCIHTQYSSARRHNLPRALARKRFPRGAKIYHAELHANIFHGRSMTQILVTSKLIFCEYLLQLNLSDPSRLSVETEALIPICNVPQPPTGRGMPL